MIRVLHVVTHMNRGGLETMIMNYYRNVDRNEVQFDFLTHRPYDGDYGDEIKELGGKIYHLPVLNPFSTRYKHTLRHFFETHPEYKIVHVHQDCLSGVILKVAKECGINARIAHSHTANQDRNFKYIIKRYYMKMISKYATKLFACSEEAGLWMFGGADFEILNNAIDVKKYIYSPQIRKKIRDELGIGEQEWVIGHVGRFSPPKNHSFLIDVFFEIRKLNSDAKLLLVGDDCDENAEKIKEKVNHLKLNDSVIFTGLRNDVPNLLQGMDIFVFPSNYEGFGIVVLEAQVSGLSCLISDKVPADCKVTGTVQQLSVAVGAEVWAKNAVKIWQETQRRDASEQIRSAGFDIKKNAKWLQNYYIKVGNAKGD